MFIISRMKMSNQIFIVFLWLFISLFLVQLPVYSQESQLKILLLDFEKIGGNQKYNEYQQKLPRQLKSFLNQYTKTDILAELFEEVRIDKESPNKIIGFPTDDELKIIKDSVEPDYNYIVAGRIWIIRSRIKSEVHLIDYPTSKTIRLFHGEEPIKGEINFAVEELAKNIAKNIETHLMANIRIGLLRFKKTGGKPEFDFLEESIPTMLATGLSASRQFLLIETKSEEQVIDELDKARRGIHDETTTLEIGKKLNVNYLIMGEFLEYKGGIRIDARCVSIETAEIILSEGITLKKVEIENISREIKVLASKIRIMIEKDFMKKEKQIKTIAVISFPPWPNNKKNRLIADNIRRTLVRKLRVVDVEELRVKEDPKKIEKYLETIEDKLKICSDLEVKSILSIQHENIRENEIILDVDLYDIEQPNRELLPESERLKYTKSDAFINDVVFKTLSKLGIDKLNETKKKDIEAIRVPTFSTRWSVGGSYSLIQNASDDLYLKSRRTPYLELDLGYQFNYRLQAEFHGGYNAGNTKIISGTDFEANVRTWLNSILFKYDFIKVSTFDIYAGLGGTFFQVFRNVKNLQSGEKGYAEASGWGLVALFGGELKIENLGISIRFEPRYYIGTKVKERTEIGFDFPGGRLGGLYLTTGISYNFNF